MAQETVLQTLPGNDDGSRLVVVVEVAAEGSSRLVLRHESWAEKVGWFVQSRVLVEPEQVAGLRAALGAQDAPKARPRLRPAAKSQPVILPFVASA